MLGLLEISNWSNLNIDEINHLTFMALSQGGIRPNLILYHMTHNIPSKASKALTESAYGCYISGGGWSTYVLVEAMKLTLQKKCTCMYART